MSTQVEPGDFVRDRMDNNRLRKVTAIWNNEVHFEDGGVMDLDDIKDDDVLLESEGYDEYYG